MAVGEKRCVSALLQAAWPTQPVVCGAGGIVTLLSIPYAEVTIHSPFRICVLGVHGPAL